jgi:acyl-[acyl-carrier-protein] desaturase
VLPLLRTLGVLGLTGLGPDGQQAQERIGQHVEQLQTQAARARELYARMKTGATHR